MRKVCTKQIADYVKAQVVEYLKNNPRTTTKDVAIALDITTARAQYYCNSLLKSKHITKGFKVVGKTRHAVYTCTGKKFDASVLEEIERQEREPTPLEKATRVVRLLDNPLKPAPEPKKKAKIHIGSGMSLFNNY